MQLSYKWLRELVPALEATPEQVAEKLTAIGLELEEEKAFAPGLEPVRVVEVVGIKPHPKREKLRLVTVNTGSVHAESAGGSVPDLPQELTVVCGAANVPEPGGLVVLAPLGTTLPAVGMTLEPKALGGIVSEGMLCSETELGLGQDSDGILCFAPGSFVPGTPFYSAFPTAEDCIFTIGVTPNRPDALGHLGVARDLAAGFGLPFELPEVSAPAKRVDALVSERVAVVNQAADSCPRYGVMAVTGVKVGPSPLWLQWRLASLGIRPISNVVDVTNLLLLEYGNPMHAFDLSKLEGARIVVRAATAGERLKTLDGQLRELVESDLVIADGANPSALGGVMGGADSEITEQSTEVLLEAAYFQPSGIRRTAKRLGLHSDSSYRFERGVNWATLENVLNRAAQLLTEFAGAQALTGQLFAEGKPLELPLIRFRSKRLNALLGVEIDFGEALSILARLGFKVEAEQEGQAAIRGASWRPDVRIEADLIEEVARIRGLDTIPAQMPRIIPQPQSHAVVLQRRVRAAAAGLGLNEAVTYSFVAPRDLERLHARPSVVKLQHPLSEERSVLTTSLLPGLLECWSRAQRRGQPGVRLFTVASRFLPPPGELPGPKTQHARPRTEEDVTRLPEERLSFAALVAGERDSYLSRPESADVFDAKGIALDLIGRLTSGQISVSQLTGKGGKPHLHPRGQAEILVDGQLVGSFGQLHPEVADSFELDGGAFVVELDLVALETLEHPAPRYRPVPKLPAVTRDVALEASEEVSAAELTEAIKASAGELCESVSLFDLFRSKELGPDRRSLAFRLVYRDPRAASNPDEAKTLTDKQVDKQHQKVLKAVQKLGVSLRA